MGDIKETGLGANRHMLGDDTGVVLHRQQITGKGDDFSV